MFEQKILFILGLSGAGKTHLGDYLAEKLDWVHMNVDREYSSPSGKPMSGIDFYSLKDGWIMLRDVNNCRPLIDVIEKHYEFKGKKGAVLSFSSNRILTKEHIKIIRHKAKVIYLFSKSVNCFRSFKKREQEACLARVKCDFLKHWWTHNSAMRFSLERIENNKFDTFYDNGSRKSAKEIYFEIFEVSC